MMSKAKQPVGKLKSSPTSSLSGVKFLKTFAPSIRRRRQCDKEKLEIYNLETNNDNLNIWDAIPASPITPPAAFLPPGYKRSGKFLSISCKKSRKKILDTALSEPHRIGKSPSPQTSLNGENRKKSPWELSAMMLKHSRVAEAASCESCTGERARTKLAFATPSSTMTLMFRNLLRTLFSKEEGESTKKNFQQNFPFSSSSSC